MLLVPYLADCQLLRALAVALDLPPPCTTSALSLLHRVKACAPPGGPQLTAQELVSACIFVASKIEEVNVSANHLINSARLLSHPSQQHLLHALAPLNANLLQQQEQGEGTAPSAATATATAQDTSDEQQPQLQSSTAALASGEDATQHQQDHQQDHQQQRQQQEERQNEPPDLEKQASLASHQQQQQQPKHKQPEQQQQSEQQQQQQQLEQQQQPQPQQPPSVVVGDAYYAAKDRLFIAEQVVLRLTSFQLAAEQPHKHLLNFCRLLGASRAAAAAAVCLLNDALGYTRLSLTTAAPVLAAAALQAAFELLLQMQQRGQQRTKQEKQQGGAPRGDAEGSEAAAAALSFSINSSHQGRGPQQQRPTQQHWQQRQRQPPPNGSRPDTAAAVGGVCSQAAAGAVADGSWVALIGLSRQEVDGVRQQLVQLLAAAPAPEDPADAAPAAAL